MSEMYKQYRKGWVEVICGCMFAGKTEELIRRVRVLSYAKQNISVFKPKLDDRYSEDHIASHAGTQVKSHVIENAEEILRFVTEDTDVVAIDEVQFFDEKVVDVCRILADRGIRVMCAGLDLDFRGEPFGVMPELLSEAEFVTKLSAVCMVCGAPATRTQRILNGKPADYRDALILVGASEQYEARCRHCHEVPHRPMYRDIRTMKEEER